MKNYLLLMMLTLFLCSSCYVQRYPVNDGPVGKGNYQLVDEGKQSWLFWGLMPLKSPDLKLPQDKNYQIETRFNVVDYILTVITLGIYNSSTVRIYSKQ